MKKSNQLLLAALVALLVATSVAKVEAFCLWDYCLDCDWFICWGE